MAQTDGCAQHPDNVWSLHGLAKCLRHRGAEKELAVILPKRNAALALADTAITLSCCCRET